MVRLLARAPSRLCVLEEYLATRERLRANVSPRGEGGGAASEGGGLLQGLLRCGHCGRRMQVAYSGQGRSRARYACVRGYHLHGTETTCQTSAAVALDKRSREAFLEAVAPGGDPRAPRRSRRSAAARGRLAGQRLAVERASSRPSALAASSTRASPRTVWWRARWRKLEIALGGVEREQRSSPSWSTLVPSRSRPPSGGARANRARPAATVGGVDDHRPRPQGTAAHADQRSHRDRPPAPENTPRSRSSGRAALAASSDPARPPRGETQLHRRGHDRADPPARCASSRSADRRDPQPTAPATGTGLLFTATRVNRPASAPGSPPLRHRTLTAASSRSTGRERARVPARPSAGGCAQGCCQASRSTSHAPWRIRLTDEVRARFVPEIPDGYLPLDEAAKRLGAPAKPFCIRSSAASLTLSKS